MLERCRRVEGKSYPNYGGRGITVCEKWKTFEGFFEDMGNPPGPRLSLDRKNNDGNYCKENCRWATASEQGLNTRRSAFVEINGERKRVRDVEISLGLAHGALWQRLKLGWSIEKACSTPRISP
ncbi:MAG TPA: hypothetical protein VGL34_24975 [Steroidobacteraceae bacterium]|jgi:hypothetical protein